MIRIMLHAHTSHCQLMLPLGKGCTEEDGNCRSISHLNCNRRIPEISLSGFYEVWKSSFPLKKTDLHIVGQSLASGVSPHVVGNLCIEGHDHMGNAVYSQLRCAFLRPKRA